MNVDDLSVLPPSQRFFAGGDRSVRGYRYQRLGPTDAAGAVVGGRYLVTASAEVDYLFFRNYGAAVFYDAGNAGERAVAGRQTQRRHGHAVAHARRHAADRHRASARRPRRGLSAALEHRVRLMKRPLMKRMLWKASLALGVLLLAVVVAAGGLLLWAARSESGLRFVWQRVAPLLPEGISVAAVEGRLAGPLVLAGITVQTDALEVRVERVELRWQPRALLRRVVRIERLDVRGVDVVRLPAEQPASPSEPFRLPESVELPVDVQRRRRFRRNAALPLESERGAVVDRARERRGQLRRERARAPRARRARPGLRRVGRRARRAARLVRDERAARLGRAARRVPEARGSTRVSGNLELLAIEQRVEPPYDARVDLRVHDALAALRLDGEVALTVQPAAFGVEQVPAETVGATLQLRGTPRALDVTGRVELTGGEAGGAAADFAAAVRAATRSRSASLAVADARSSAALQASGRVAVGGEQPVLELDATWAQLQWPLRGKPQVASESGSLRLKGTPHDYAVALDGNLALADGTNGQVRVSGTGNAEALALDRVDIEALRGRIAGRMNVRWAPSLSGALELTGTALDPGVVLPDWPGQVDARVHAQAALEGESLTVELHALEADGRLRDRPLELRARGGYAASALRIDAFTLRSGATDATARGTAGKELALEWQVESPALGEAVAGASKARSRRAASCAAHASGRTSSVEARGQALRFMGSAVEDLELTADVDVAGQAHSSLALNVSRREGGGRRDCGVALDRRGQRRTTRSRAGERRRARATRRLQLSGAVDAAWTA